MKICIIGQGNVAYHFYTALKDKVETVKVNSRTLTGFVQDADVYVIAVSDDAIEATSRNVINNLNDKITVRPIIVHTSGSSPILKPDNDRYKTGVIYPAQTLSKHIKTNYSAIPFFIEGSDKSSEEILAHIAGLISDNVRNAKSECRQKIHLAAVFACNFTNHLWVLAEEILKEKGLDFEILKPLIKETLNKVENTSPFYVQTGPAVRYDKTTINSHLNSLKYNPDTLDIYALITKSIQKHHECH